MRLDAGPEGRADADFTGNDDAPTMQFRGGLYNREAQAGARPIADIARAMETFEQLRQVIGRNADALIREREGDLVARFIHRDGDRASLRRIFQRVGEEVDGNVAQQLLVDEPVALRQGACKCQIVF